MARSDPDRLRDKAQIKRLISEAQKILRQSTTAAIAAAIGIESAALAQAVSRGSLAGHHRRALEHVIATGAPLPKSLQSDELNALRERLDESYASLGLKGRAQFSLDFTGWLEARVPILRRLDRHHVRAIEHDKKSG